MVRQLSAAVYIFIGYALFVHFLRDYSWPSYLEPLFVLGGGVLVALLVDGPWWAIGFVGFFVAALDAAFRFVMREDGEAVALSIGQTVVVLTLAGALGAALGRWRRGGRSLRPTS